MKNPMDLHRFVGLGDAEACRLIPFNWEAEPKSSLSTPLNPAMPTN